MKRWIPFMKSSPTVAVLRLSGVIGTGSRGQLNDQTLAPLLEKAFRRGKPTAVALEINSPGGSPVQSSLIAQRIRRLSEEQNVPVLAFVEDVAASGGYWLAASADEIFADENSVVGSIGVISAGFGAHVFLSRQGLERRVYTAGESKSVLDPFKPENPDDVKRLQALLEQIHANFIRHVKSRRGSKLSSAPEIFTGQFWAGQNAEKLGLIDGLGHTIPVLKEKFGNDVKLRRYGVRRPVWQRLGASLMQDAVAGIEERAEYARFGL
ncbi:S49 family peptidase [Pseudopelagicola sp. nBUS_19]|uniref:S49 family peptidase n=1 Tax=Pseudopelagicola sp. nBUS_19 TaxID=3395316 RepID=UPI003EC067C4